MPFRFLGLWVMLASLFFAAGCATPAKTAKPPTSGDAAAKSKVVADSPAQQEKRATAHAHYIAGLSHELNREIDKALVEYELALEGDPRGRDHQRADREQRDVERVDESATQAVGQLGHDRRADQVEQHVDRQHPRDRAFVDAEVGAQRGQRRADDGDVERAHQHADEQDGQDRAGGGASLGGGHTRNARRNDAALRGGTAAWPRARPVDRMRAASGRRGAVRA